MPAIVCPACKQSESFTLVQNIFVTTDIDRYGRPVGGTDYANEGRHRWINCPCGHSWRTRRGFDISPDVR